MRIEIDDHDEPALTSVRVMAVTVPPVVVVSLAANDGNVPGATLYFGGHRTEAPRYDLSTLAAAAAARGDHTAADLMDQLREPSALTVASLGTVTDNPRFGATPLLQFAMRPGAAIDVRGYSHRRPFTVPPSRDGLSLLALEPDDLAIAADDLSDVRVVDAHGQQWSYLLVPNATATWTTLPVGRPQTTKRVSRYKLTLPSRPLRSDRALVEIATPFFDRAYRLVTRDAAGTEQVLAEGRLSRRATHPVPLLIPLPPTRCYGLVLEIEDGDDAPLPISGLQLRLPGPTLYLAAPAGEYALLVGDPMAVTPSYELEQVRDLVLATTGVVAQPHALEANPTFAATARLTHSGRTTVVAQRWLVWAALLAAVAAVTMVTLRSARQKL